MHSLPRVPDLDSLELLLYVAATGSYGEAGRRAGISQQAVSTRMKSTERLVGVALFESGPRGTRLTDAGALVAEWAERILEVVGRLDAGLAALRKDEAGRLKVAASQTVAEFFMPRWLMALRRSYQPGGDRSVSPQGELSVRLTVANSVDVAAMVLAGEADVGFCEGPDIPLGLASVQVASDELFVVVAPAHPWARRTRPLGPAELAGTPLVQREASSGTRGTLAMALGAQGLSPAEPLMELSSISAIRAAVVAGAGAAVISSLAVAEDLASGRLVRIGLDGVDLGRSMRAIWRESSKMPRAARGLVDAAQRARGR